MVAARADAARPIPRLPGGKPLLGHLLEMQRNPLALLTRVRDELGDVGAIQIGPRHIVVVSDPAITQHILVDNVRNYSKQTRGYDQLRMMVGNGLVTSEGSFWLRQRRIAQPAFHKQKLAALAAVMQRDTDQMIERWQPLMDQQRSFDFAGEMMQLTMRIIGEVLFSQDVSGATDAAGAAVNELVHQAIARTVSLFNVPTAVPTPLNRRFTRSKRTLDELVYGIIEKRRAGARKDDLLSMLLDAVDEETGEKMTDGQLRDEVLTAFTAGHETTSTLLAWTLHVLLDRPDVEEKLRAEIDAAGGAPLAVEQLMRMPYLDAVVKESMRLHPPVWMVARCCESDEVVKGFHFPKGHLVFVSQWTTHRHPRLWPDPLRFDPARFLSDDPARARYAYFPFLGGPRKCIGDALATLEAKLILSTLVHRLRFARAPGHVVTPDPAVTLRMKDGLRVTARRVSSRRKA